MEFYQFHPTALAIEGAPRFLVSEALRGEGAYLRNDRGERFMERYHPLLELAPRDVVARAIAREGLADIPGSAEQDKAPAALRPVYLDMRHVRDIDLAARFPGISAFLAHYGLDLSRDLIPVRPAAHYLMGGIRTDLDGRTSLAGLYAAGEAACTGVHGANRLASNSLLEGLVFGARAARSMLADAPPLTHAAPDPGRAPMQLSPSEEAHVECFIAALQASMWANAGLLREASSLQLGLAAQAETRNRFGRDRRNRPRQPPSGRSDGPEPRGARHSRFRARPHGKPRRALPLRLSRRDDANFNKHSVIGREGRVRFEEW